MRYELMSSLELLQKHRDLLERNFSESGNGIAFRPSEDFYQELADGTDGFAFAVYDGDKVVGAASVFVAPHQHSGDLTAMNDTIFVLPEYRGTAVPGRLFVMCEREAARRGCTAFQWACNVGSPMANALARREHAACQITFTRSLK